MILTPDFNQSASNTLVLSQATPISMPNFVSAIETPLNETNQISKTNMDPKVIDVSQSNINIQIPLMHHVL